jgi:hypothetical protein
LHRGDCALYYGAGAGPIFSYEEIVDLELCPIVSSDVKGEDLGVGRQNPPAPANTEVIWSNGFANCLIMIEISIMFLEDFLIIRNLYTDFYIVTITEGSPHGRSLPTHRKSIVLSMRS